MKSLHTILATALLAATIAGCGKSGENESGTVPVTYPPPPAGSTGTQPPEPLGDVKSARPTEGSTGSALNPNPSSTSPSTNTPPAPTASATTPPPSEEAKDQKSERPKSGANGGEVK